MDTKLKTYGALTTTLVIASLILPVNKYLLHYFTPGTLTLFRVICAEAIFAIIAIYKRPRLPELKDVPRFMVLGIVCYGMYQIIINNSLMHLKAGTVSLLGSTTTIFVAVLSTFILREKNSRLGWTGIIICTVGSMVVSVGDNPEFTVNSWIFMVLLAVLFDAGFNILAKQLLNKYTAYEFSTYLVFPAVIPPLIYAPDLVKSLPSLPGHIILIAFMISLFGHVIGSFISKYVLARLPASRMVAYYNVVPIGTLVIAWILVKETPSLVTLFGAVLIFAGLYLVSCKNKTC